MWKPYGVGQPSCAPLRNRVQHTSDSDLPCHSSKPRCLWDLSLRFWHNSVMELCCSPSTSKIFRPNRLAFCNFAPHLRHVFKLSLPSPCRQHPLTRIIAFCVERLGTPIQGLHSILLQAKISPIFFPTRNQTMDDSKDCAPPVPLDRQLSLNCVVSLLSVFWSKSSDIPLPKDEEVPERLWFRLVCVRTASLANPEQPGKL